MMANGVCMDQTVNLMLMGLGTATTNAAIPIGPMPYTTTADTGNNSQTCRIYHLSVASTSVANAQTYCIHGTTPGGGVCGSNMVSNLCTFIGGTCGFGMSSWQFSSAAACMSALMNVSFGNATDTAVNTLACRYYHAGVAGSYGPLSMNSNASTYQLHCGHVLMPPASAGGCGAAMMGNTSAAPTSQNATTSGAFAHSLVVVCAVVFASFCL
jgi:hypothetical protein